MEFLSSRHKMKFAYQCSYVRVGCKTCFQNSFGQGHLCVNIDRQNPLYDLCRTFKILGRSFFTGLCIFGVVSPPMAAHRTRPLVYIYMFSSSHKAQVFLLSRCRRNGNGEFRLLNSSAPPPSKARQLPIIEFIKYNNRNSIHNYIYTYT